MWCDLSVYSVSWQLFHSAAAAALIHIITYRVTQHVFVKMFVQINF